MRGRSVSGPDGRLRGTDGLERGRGRAGECAHDDRGAAPGAHELGAVAAVGVRAVSRMDLLEGLVATTSGTVSKRLAHRCAPFASDGIVLPKHGGTRPDLGMHDGVSGGSLAACRRAAGL